MAYLNFYRNKLRHNYRILCKLFQKNNIEWGIVTKLLCGNELYLKEVLALGHRQVCDSRLSNLKKIKNIDPGIETIYIKPPPKNIIKSIVKYADMSLNSEFSTIKQLSQEALRQKKIHKIIIMIEMGELREGILGDHLLDFYSKVFKLKGIEVVGLGTNLNCLNGIMPSQDKLIQLSLYKQIIGLKFNRKLQLLSGGNTSTVPLIYRHQIPREINHFRIGEALFFGADLFTGKTLKGMFPNVFELFAQIIELSEKPVVPYGEMGENPYGEVYKVDTELYGQVTYRALIDVGNLDINPDYLAPVDPDIRIVGASSDMMVIDLGENKAQYCVGRNVCFRIKYMGVLGLMNSDYIEKKIV